jgi:hypothetical protein
MVSIRVSGDSSLCGGEQTWQHLAEQGPMSILKGSPGIPNLLSEPIEVWGLSNLTSREHSADGLIGLQGSPDSRNLKEI